jgi:hypothetical protein
MKRALAEEMRVCWKEWLKGEEEMFEEDNGIFCHVCSIVDFKHKNKQIEDFRKYLSITNIPDGSQKYQQYLSAYMSMDVSEFRSKYGVSELTIEQIQDKAEGVPVRTLESDEEIPDQFSDVPIDTSKEYATIFLYVKGMDNIEKTLKFFDRVSQHEQVYVVGGGSIIVGVGILGALKAGGASAAVLTVTGVGAVAVPVLIVGGLIVGGVFLYDNIMSEKDVTNVLAKPVLVEWNADTLIEMGCEISPAVQEE